jgi:beta-ureidopropionase / N-carbamoyl-L-amino-acid hydrolase
MHATSAASEINSERLAGLLERLAYSGRTANGGLNRLAASREDGSARDFLCDWLRRQGCRVCIDGVGNIYGVLEIAAPGAPLVLTGSHLDSQPGGGRFDGVYGVAAACEALACVRDLVKTQADSICYNLGVVSWTNEEGARFAPSCLGSGVYAGRYTPEFALSRADGDGVSLAKALADIGYLGQDTPPRAVCAYIEAHIEQGPVLEREQCVIGVVAGNWATAKYIVDLKGTASHTGPTPMAERRDALLAAAHLILSCRAMADESQGQLLTSVGRLDIRPNSTNVVAGHVRLYAEFRALEQPTVDASCRRFEREASAAGELANVTIELDRVIDRRAGQFDAELCQLIERTAVECRYPTMRLNTIAGHDAISMRNACPSAMIFVPSAGGISHNETEYTEPQHLQAGATVLTKVLWNLLTRRHAV